MEALCIVQKTLKTLEIDFSCIYAYTTLWFYLPDLVVVCEIKNGQCFDFVFQIIIVLSIYIYMAAIWIQTQLKYDYGQHISTITFLSSRTTYYVNDQQQHGSKRSQSCRLTGSRTWPLPWSLPGQHHYFHDNISEQYGWGLCCVVCLCHLEEGSEDIWDIPERNH